MKRFQFKLEAVRTLKKTREEEALRDLAMAQRKFQEELNTKQQLLQDLRNSLQRRERLGQGQVDLNAMALEQEFIVGTKQRIIQADQRILRANKFVEKHLRIYLKAKSEKKTLDVLYEKAFQEYRKERMKYEQKNLEDLTIMRARLREDSES